ncbi:hypothetical protein JOE44_001241 [Chryseobacterium sp. PvR013]|nr:hypothetical protein [Chryseobacterium sp. PvR013]
MAQMIFTDNTNLIGMDFSLFALNKPSSMAFAGTL